MQHPFIFFLAICNADKTIEAPPEKIKTDKAEIINKPEITTENDGIIKAAHSRGCLVMATPPYWGRESTKTAFEPAASYIGQVIDNKVVLIVLEDYEKMIQRTRAGQIDIGLYGAALYVETQKLYPQLSYIATSIWKKTGRFTYFSYLITRKGSGLSSIQSLRGKSLAFGSRESTGGYMYPLAWMKENGMEPESYFSSIRFLGSHNNVLDAVAQGKVDAGTVSPGPLEKAEKKYGDMFNRLRKFGPIPGTVVAVNGTLSEDLIKKITQALISLPEEITAPEEMDFKGFKILSDKAYDQLREAIEITRE